MKSDWPVIATNLNLGPRNLCTSVCIFFACLMLKSKNSWKTGPKYTHQGATSSNFRSIKIRGFETIKRMQKFKISEGMCCWTTPGGGGAYSTPRPPSCFATALLAIYHNHFVATTRPLGSLNLYGDFPSFSKFNSSIPE